MELLAEDGKAYQQHVVRAGAHLSARPEEQQTGERGTGYRPLIIKDAVRIAAFGGTDQAGNGRLPFRRAGAFMPSPESGTEHSNLGVFRCSVALVSLNGHMRIRP